MPVTRHPLHGSVRAELPHTALASGHDAQTLVRIRMADAWGRQPVIEQAPHAAPTQMVALTAAAQGAMPQATHLLAEGTQTRAVARHAEVTHVPTHHRAQVRALRGNRLMHPPSEFELDRLRLVRRRLALVSRSSMNLPFRLSRNSA